MPAESAPALSREGRIHPEDLDLRQRAVRWVNLITISPFVRQRLKLVGNQKAHPLLRSTGRRGLEIVGEELIDLANAGAPAAGLELYPQFVREVVDDVLKRSHGLDRAALEAAEMAADVTEDSLQGPALLRGRETPVEKLSRASALRLQAANSFALARALEREALTEQLGHHRRVS